MRYIIQVSPSDKIIKFEFYSVDEVNELEITIDNTDCEIYVNLNPKQVDDLIKFLTEKKHIY